MSSTLSNVTYILPKFSNNYPERQSALDLKDSTTPRFGHSNVVFDLFITLQKRPNSQLCNHQSLRKSFMELCSVKGTLPVDFAAASKLKVGMTINIVPNDAISNVVCE